MVMARIGMGAGLYRNCCSDHRAVAIAGHMQAGQPGKAPAARQGKRRAVAPFVSRPFVHGRHECRGGGERGARVGNTRTEPGLGLELGQGQGGRNEP